MSNEKLEMLNDKILDENTKNKKLQELNDKISNSTNSNVIKN